jgi:transcription termination/antitermination protein NusG
MHPGAKRDGQWVAVQARVGRELPAHDYLSRAGYEAFCPVRRSSERGKATVAALFPGYFFCRYIADWNVRIVQAPGVVRIVSGCGNPIAVDADQLAAIRRINESPVTSEVEEGLQWGEPVRIRVGPLQDLAGIFVERRGPGRFVINVPVLTKSIAVVVPRAAVERLSA